MVAINLKATSLSANAEICITQGHNVTFISAPAPVDAATSAVLSECQNNPVTNNTDCVSNMACTDGANAPSANDMVTCQTESHNIPFVNRGPRSQIDTTVTQLLSTCDNNPVSTNADCTANLSCDQ